MAIQQTFDFLVPEPVHVGSERLASERLASERLASERLASGEPKRKEVFASVISPTRRLPPPNPRYGSFPTDFLRSTRTIELARKAAPVRDRDQVLRDLRSMAGCITTAVTTQAPTFSTGCQTIDHWLPLRGLRTDSITEWVADNEACGATTLSLITTATLLGGKECFSRGPLVIVADPENFYPPAAAALGIPLDRIIWIRPVRHADAVWAIDQSLRCESVAAVWANLSANLDPRDARRFQLAAETGSTPGLFVRPLVTRGRPSFADVRFHVQRVPAAKASAWKSSESSSPTLSPLQITLDRCRGTSSGRGAWVEINDAGRVKVIVPEVRGKPNHETAAVRLASELAHPKTAKRPAVRRRA